MATRERCRGAILDASLDRTVRFGYAGAMSDEPRYISIPDPDASEFPEGATYPYMTGARVKAVHGFPGMVDRGIPAGTLGTVTGHGRSPQADAKFAIRKRLAAKAGRDLSDGDYEILIDEEGPTVRFDNGKEDWFPGQAITAIEPAS